MREKLVIINHNATSYRKASKKVKSQILTELSQILHRNRQYVGYLLRNSKKVVLRNGNIQILTDATVNEKSKKGRREKIRNEVAKALKKIWPLTEFV